MSRNLLPYGCLPKLEGFQEIHLKGMTRNLVRLEYNLALRSCHFQVPKIPTFKTKSQFLGEGASAHRLKLITEAIFVPVGEDPGNEIETEA